jgi:hypothetical protein
VNHEYTIVFPNTKGLKDEHIVITKELRQGEEFDLEGKIYVIAKIKHVLIKPRQRVEKITHLDYPIVYLK